MGTVLRRLRIENLVLIREAELELDGGLNAITGETGAGKTILSGAIGLLLGAKGDTGAIGAAAAEAYVEAEFDLPEEEMLGELAELCPVGEETLVAEGRRCCAAEGGGGGTRRWRREVLRRRWRCSTTTNAGRPTSSPRPNAPLRLSSGSHRSSQRPASRCGPPSSRCARPRPT